MGIGRLEQLLSPRSIAVVGGRRAVLAIEQCERLGFEGSMWLVNPTTERIGDRVTHRSLADLPEVPDAVLVAVDADKTIGVVSEAAELGVAGAVAYASGFAEAGRADRSQALEAAAGDMVVLGPNCHGFINALTGAALWPDVSGCERSDRGVAIVSQSGNIAINLTMQQRGIAISHVITLGNQLDVAAADCIEALVAEGRVDAIGLYIEGVPDSMAFASACARAHDAGVPVVALTAGGSDNGEALVRSHTAALAGSRVVRSALLARYGVSEVTTPDELMATLAVLGRGGRLPGMRVVSLSSSGGEAALIADRAETLPIRFDPFGESQRRKLEDLLDGRVPVTNPFDYHTYIWGDRAKMAECFSVALDHCDVAMLVLDWPATGIDDSDWWPTLDAFCDAVTATGTRGLVTSTLADNLPVGVAEYLGGRSIAAVPGMGHALSAIVAAAPVSVSAGHHGGDGWTGKRVIGGEVEAKELLRRFGLAVPRGVVCQRDDLGVSAESIGFPVVVKSLAAAHRSDVGGVAVALRSVGEVDAAGRAMAQLGATFLVEQYISDVVAELIVGIAYDAQIGWSLTIGAGGVLAELIRDTATLLLPSTADDLERALRKLDVAHILDGYRNSPPADVQALVEGVNRVAVAAVERRVELEINPLLVCERGVWIGDALMVTLEPQP